MHFMTDNVQHRGRTLGSGRIIKPELTFGKVNAKINVIIEQQQFHRSFYIEPSVERVRGK